MLKRSLNLRRAILSSPGILVASIVATASCSANVPAEENATETRASASLTASTCPPIPAPASDPVALWPGGIITYVYDGVPGPETKAGSMQNAIRKGMDDWQLATGNRVLFTPGTPGSEAVRIHDIQSAISCVATCTDALCPSTTCPSTFPLCESSTGLCRTDDACHTVGLGWQPGPGPQDMYLADGQCNIPHELGHLIGLEHEQVRADRDRYITVHTDSVLCGAGKVVPTEDDGANLGPYDITSVMQYGTANITPPDLTLHDGTRIPASDVLSPVDASEVVEMYARQYEPAWKRAVPMGIDIGSNVPLSNLLAPNVAIALDTSPGAARSATATDLFVRGTDTLIYHRSAFGTGKEWGAWSPLNGSSGVGSPGAAYIDGVLYAAERDGSGNVVVGEVGPSMAWVSIGRPAGLSATSDPVMVNTAPGLIDLMVRGSDDAMWQRRRTGRSWGPWRSRGGIIAGTPTAVSPSANTIYLFANTPEGIIVQNNMVGSTWSGWFTVPNGSCCLAAGSSPTVAMLAPTRMELLVRATDDRLWSKPWNLATGWESFHPIGGILKSDPVAVTGGSSRVDAFYVSVEDKLGDGHNTLWHRERRASRPKGDFDGDGLGDFAYFANSSWFIDRRHRAGRASRTGAAQRVVTWGQTMLPGVPEDFDNDGITDPVGFRGSDGTWFITKSTDGSILNQPWGDTADRLQSGDYDGDGRADFVLFRPSDGNWYINPSSTAPAITQAWGGATDIMVPGDYDGDGINDEALYRQDLKFYILQSATHTQAPLVQLGAAGNGAAESMGLPVPGDYDGDGKTDPAIYDQANGNWKISPSSGGPIYVINIRETVQDIPVPKDYDGDGKTDQAVYTPSTFGWKVLMSHDGSLYQTTFGAAGAIPF